MNYLVMLPLLFGFYHVYDDVPGPLPVNVVHAQQGNARENPYLLLEENPQARLIYEINPLVKIPCADGSRYPACWKYIEHLSGPSIEYTAQILAPIKGKVFAIYLTDEIVLTPDNLIAIQTAINRIRSNPVISDIALWINFNQSPTTLPDGINIVSKTPYYGLGPSKGVYREVSGYTDLIPAITKYNRSHPASPVRVVVVGDGMRGSPKKAREMYEQIKAQLNQYGIQVLGQFVFAWSWLERNPTLKATWLDIADEFLNGSTPPVDPCGK